MPILGCDFLAAHNLTIDIAAGIVLTPDKTPLRAAPVQSTGAKLFRILHSVPEAVRDLLTEFPAVLGTAAKQTQHHNKHGVEHHIQTTGQPVFARPRRLNPEKLAAAKSEFTKMEAAGICHRGESPWSSPLHIVPKKDGNIRPCGDYRRLNLQTVPDRYPLPHISDFSNHLYNCTVFSKLDLLKGYFQIPLADKDKLKAAVITPFGLFIMDKMPFGLRNAAQTLQRMMDKIMQGLPYIFIYLDDVLIASPDLQSHLIHLREVLRRLHNNGLAINLEKCEFLRSEVSFLGHNISSKGIRPLADKIAAVADMPFPDNHKKLQQFLGMINFYRKFLPSAAKVLLPLTNQLKSPSPSISRTPELESAFTSAKQLLTGATTLTFPNPKAELSLSTDASNTHVGAVLEQTHRGVTEPLAFFSYKLSPAEAKYSTFDRELLAIIKALRHFRYNLEGKHFNVFTDHRPLVQALHRSTEAWSARQTRSLSYIAEFDLTLQYIPGKLNSVADALSRPLANAVVPDRPILPEELDVPRLVEDQQSCPGIKKLLAKPSSLRIQPVEIQLAHTSLQALCDISTGKSRLLIPETFKQKVFQSIHNIHHPGVRATRRLITTRYVWLNAAKEINDMAKHCVNCQQSKIHKHTKTLPVQLPTDGPRFSALNLDLVGPMVSSQGFRYLFTIIDRNTRWLEAIPLKSTAAQDILSAFIQHWISRFGLPNTITTDNGTQFQSSVFKHAISSLNIKHIFSPTYAPRANGMVERVHRQLKAALRARCAEDNWVNHLPWVMLGLRANPRDSENCSAFQRVFGSTPTLPGPTVNQDPSDTDAWHKAWQDSVPSLPNWPTRPAKFKEAIPKDLRSASQVWIRHDAPRSALTPVYTGPHKVLRQGRNTYLIKIGARTERIATDRLKPVKASSPQSTFQPKKRGRPPKGGAVPV